MSVSRSSGQAVAAAGFWGLLGFERVESPEALGRTFQRLRELELTGPGDADLGHGAVEQLDVGDRGQNPAVGGRIMVARHQQVRHLHCGHHVAQTPFKGDAERGEVPDPQRPPQVRREEALGPSDVQDLTLSSEHQRQDVRLARQLTDAPGTQLLGEDRMAVAPQIAQEIPVVDGDHHLRAVTTGGRQTVTGKGDPAPGHQPLE